MRFGAACFLAASSMMLMGHTIVFSEDTANVFALLDGSQAYHHRFRKYPATFEQLGVRVACGPTGKSHWVSPANVKNPVWMPKGCDFKYRLNHPRGKAFEIYAIDRKGLIAFAGNDTPALIPPKCPQGAHERCISGR